MKVHYRDIRLFNNAGLDLPTCKATARLLDTECRWPTTPYGERVTCKRCIREMRVHYGVAPGDREVNR